MGYRRRTFKCSKPASQIAMASHSEKVESLRRLRHLLANVKHDISPREISPGVYIGSIGAAFNKSGLKDIGITHILCLASGIFERIEFTQLLWLRRTLVTCTLTQERGGKRISHPGDFSVYEKEFEYEIIHAKDIPEEKLENCFEQSAEFIDNSVKMGGKCLIHCFAGLFTIRYRSLVIFTSSVI